MTLVQDLKTRRNLLARNIASNPVCALCQIAEESCSHAFVECRYSLVIWKKLLSKFGIQPHSQASFEGLFDWLISNRDLSEEETWFLLSFVILLFFGTSGGLETRESFATKASLGSRLYPSSFFKSEAG